MKIRPKIVINDVFEELCEENDRLLSELTFSEKWIELLENYRKCLIDLNEKCICDQNIGNKNTINSLESQYKTLEIKSFDRYLSKNSIIKSSQKWNSNNESEEETHEEELATRGEPEEMVSKYLDIKSKVKSFKQKDNYRKEYVCDWVGCEERYATSLQLKAHIRQRHRNNKPFQCLDCSKCFAAEELLRRHEKYHEKYGRDKFKCDHNGCPYETPFRSSLKSHQLKHSTVQYYRCRQNGCEKAFKSKHCFERHKHLIHNTKHTNRKVTKSYSYFKYVCDRTDCEAKYQKISELKAHVSQCHPNEKPFRCHECSKAFGSDPELQIHERYHQKCSGVKFKCDFKGCPFETAFEANLKIHKLRHSEVRAYMCDQIGCGKRFKLKTYLDEHNANVHRPDRPFECEWPGCESSFKSKKDLVKHKLIHTNERQFGCDFNACPKRFNTRADLNKHRLTHENRHKTYACSWPACEYVCSTKSKLTVHMNRHENRRPHSCPADGCHKAFYNKFDLNTHVFRIHDKSASNVRFFRCDFEDCSKGFRLKSDLTKHRKRHEHKPYVCTWPECDYRSAENSSLTAHLNKHLNIRPNKCHFDGCDKSYLTKGTLVKHISKVHQNR